MFSRRRWCAPAQPLPQAPSRLLTAGAHGSQDYFSSSDARSRQSRLIQEEMEKTKGVMHSTIGAPRSPSRPPPTLAPRTCSPYDAAAVCAEKALERGEHLDSLVEKTDDLRYASPLRSLRSTHRRRCVCARAQPAIGQL